MRKVSHERKGIESMLIFGLQGSPRKKGNTNFLLTTFMQAAEKYGAHTHTIDVCRKNIIP